MALVWSYVPEVTMTEAFAAPTRTTPVAPQTTIAGWLVNTMAHTLRLQYATVDSATVNSMVAFYNATQGPFLAFQLLNPNDGQLYTARFDTALATEWFAPTAFQTQEITFMIVAS